MSNNNFFVRIQLKDVFKQQNINDSGAVAFVCTAGTSTLATLLDQYGNALANPIQLTSGLISFQFAASTSQEEAGLDIFGMTADGYWFEYLNAVGVASGKITGLASGANEILIDKSIKRMRMKIPFAIGNTGPAGACAAATEFKIGLALPASAMVLDRLHGMGVLVTTAQSGKTIEFGVLSTETGGTASGFINGSSLAPTAPSQLVIGTNGANFSSNAPYNTDSETGGVANGLDLSLTLSSGTTTAVGFILAPYELA
ncbi:MAG: hypothetical protein ABSA68_13355 [Xanthobacteraceae bacterium]|jgi:hypothetical protein